MPQLQDAKKATAEKIVQVDIQKKDVAEKSKAAEAENAVANEKKSSADAIQKDCEFELSRVMPIYNAAIRAVSNLKRDDITEMKGFTNPPEAAKAVVKTLCIMFNVAPKKIPDPAGGNKKVDDYWEPGKKQVLTAELLKNCQNYAKDDMTEQLIETLRPLIESE